MGSELPQPPYMVLGEQGRGHPPHHRRKVPRYHSHHNNGGGFCCACFCWCCCFLLLFVIAIAIAIFYLFVTYNPQIPSYSVKNLVVKAFEFRASDLTLYTKITATVRAVNPNDMIGITYEAGSRVMVKYRENTLCSGKLPTFYQGHRNITMIQVNMEGQHEFGSVLQKALEENELSRRIPLDVYVTVPVSLKLGEVNSQKVTVNVLCSLVIDNLSPSKKVGIESAEYKVNVEF